MCDGGIGSGDAFGGEFGGTGGCYNTPYNTLGVGDLVPAGTHELGNDFRQMTMGWPVKKPRQNRKKNGNKRPSYRPFVSQGTSSGYDMSPRPLFVPHNPRRK